MHASARRRSRPSGTNVEAHGVSQPMSPHAMENLVPQLRMTDNDSTTKGRRKDFGGSFVRENVAVSGEERAEPRSPEPPRQRRKSYMRKQPRDGSYSS